MRQKDKWGKFTSVEDDLVGTGIRLKRSHLVELQALCRDGETTSDKIREAIAYYLNCETNRQNPD
jgi:hypothetical protein